MSHLYSNFLNNFLYNDSFQNNYSRRPSSHHDRKWFLQNAFVDNQEKIIEQENGILLTIEMPNVKKEDINIEFDTNQLTITAKERSLYSEDETLISSEFSVGEITKQYDIASKIDTSKIEAKLKNGILTLRFPFTEKAALKKITVA